MATLVNITSKTPSAVQVWGFHGPCDVVDVRHAIGEIASNLSGQGHSIHIMSGTHGYCKGQVGAVAKRDQRFAKEDGALAHPKTPDGASVTLVVHDFNTASLKDEPDYVTSAMSLLNSTMRRVVTSQGASSPKPVFLLAYCCSAGTR